LFSRTQLRNLSPRLVESDLSRVRLYSTQVAQAIAKKEPASVDIIGMDPVPFAAILGEEVGKALQKVSSWMGG
jgi:hypothetical protein